MSQFLPCVMKGARGSGPHRSHLSPIQELPPSSQTEIDLGASLAARKLCTQVKTFLRLSQPALENVNRSAVMGFLSAPLGLFPTPPSIPLSGSVNDLSPSKGV